MFLQVHMTYDGVKALPKSTYFILLCELCDKKLLTENGGQKHILRIFDVFAKHQ